MACCQVTLDLSRTTTQLSSAGVCVPYTSFESILSARKYLAGGGILWETKSKRILVYKSEPLNMTVPAMCAFFTPATIVLCPSYRTPLSRHTSHLGKIVPIEMRHVISRQNERSKILSAPVLWQIKKRSFEILRTWAPLSYVCCYLALMRNSYKCKLGEQQLWHFLLIYNVRVAILRMSISVSLKVSIFMPSAYFADSLIELIPLVNYIMQCCSWMFPLFIIHWNGFCNSNTVTQSSRYAIWFNLLATFLSLS